MALLALPLMGAGAALLSSCSDWNDHYEDNGVAGSSTTLWEEIQARPELSDFARVLENTKVFRQHKKTEASYADVLKGGQSLTVFAPVNGTFNAEDLIKQTLTNSGDSAVETFFVLNHITRTPHSAIDGNFRMLNGKKVEVKNNQVWGVDIKEANLRSKNGILHVVSSELPYNKTIYEALTLQPEYSNIGKALKRYNEDIFDENASISSGLVEGVPVYVDSVVYENNKMLNVIGTLKAEDSTFYAALPQNDGWDTAWGVVSKYFKFSSAIEKADSLQEYWTTRWLLQNAIFSRTIQTSPDDSVKTYRYSRETPQYDVYYKPFAADGIFGSAKGGQSCSNGTIYYHENWPFTPTNTFFRKIEQEAEQTWMIDSYDKCNYDVYNLIGDSISKGSYLDIKGSADKWTITYKLSNTLSGKYDFNVIILPKTIRDPNLKTKPCKFKAYINYIDENGNSKRYDCGSAGFKTSKGNVDTICVAQDFYLPACNYEQNNNKVSLTIECAVNSREASTYDRNMYLDCIYLKPKE